MPATRDGKTWRSQFYYEDWQGIRHKKNKRGLKTKAEAEEWERNFRQQQRKDLDINFAILFYGADSAAAACAFFFARYSRALIRSYSRLFSRFLARYSLE